MCKLSLEAVIIVVVVVVIIIIIVLAWRKPSRTGGRFAEMRLSEDSPHSHFLVHEKNMTRLQAQEQLKRFETIFVESSKKRHRKSKSHSSNSLSRDEDCGGGGIGAGCSWNSDCACGLSCEANQCVCSKPPPPGDLIAQVSGNYVTLTWSPVPGADSYDVYLFDQNMIAYVINLHFVGTVYTASVPNGTYTGYVFSVSNNCGSLEQYAVSNVVNVSTNQPQCVTNSDCPNGYQCSAGSCVPTQQCNCATDEICVNGNTCQCPTPQITGITMYGTWPNTVQFQFFVSGAGANAEFEIPWAAKGATGAVAVSGYMPFATLNGNLWPTSPTLSFPTNNLCGGDCCPSFNFGCTQAGCTGLTDVVFEFNGIRVRNACGNTSSPTCWRLTSMCPGGPLQLVQVTC